MSEKQKAVLTEKQKAIFDKITELRDRLEDYRCEMASLYVACEGLVKERDAAIQRAEKAEKELAEQKERARVGRLHKMKKITKLRDALKLYGNPENWRFTHDKENNLLWITSLGPDYAMEILNGAQESSEERGAANALL